MAMTEGSREILTQSDYENLVLQSIVSLTNDGPAFEFSISEIAKRLERGNSVNRTMFAVKKLIEEEKIADSHSHNEENSLLYEEIEEKHFSKIIEEDEPRFYITERGLHEYDENKLDTSLSIFLVTETSFHIRLLAYIYAKTHSIFDIHVRVDLAKLSEKQKLILETLRSSGLIKTSFFDNAFTVTERGKALLESEANIRGIKLERYIKRTKDLLLNEILPIE